MKPEVIAHFRKSDPVLFGALSMISHNGLGPEKTDDVFVSLLESVVNQQLSEKAGRSIWTRFTSLFASSVITPEALLALSDDRVRNMGISWSKVSYLKNIARAAREGNLDVRLFDSISDEEVVTRLTRIKGIGRWTAEMTLMFCLGRDDVFSFGDVGLVNAIRRLYRYRRQPGKALLTRMCKKWSPYRTYACRILWRYLDTPDGLKKVQV